MTLFWPEPTSPPIPWTRLAPPGIGLEEEYAPAPAPTTRTDFAALGITGPGFGEIKPHNRDGVEGAHKQLTKIHGREETALAAWDQARIKKGKRPKITHKILVTYRPTIWPKRPTKAHLHPRTVDVYAIRFQPGWTPGKYLAATDWVSIGPADVPPSVPVDLTNRSIFGAAMEQPIRALVHERLKALKRPRKPANIHKSAHATGPDIEWKELAELYAELARELEDPFLAELAGELAALR